jgi:alkylhydroperoxidase family enzyme
MTETSIHVLPASRERLVEVAGDRVGALDKLHRSLWELVPDPAIVELCQLRVADLLGSAGASRSRTPTALAGGLDESRIAALANWESSPLFDARERAYLEFTEQFVMSVRHVDDAQIAALCAYDTPTDVCAFVAALYVLELTQRIDLVSHAVLGGEEVVV